MTRYPFLLIYCLFIPIAIAAQPYDRTSPDPDMPRPIPARDSVFTGFFIEAGTIHPHYYFKFFYFHLPSRLTRSIAENGVKSRLLMHPLIAEIIGTAILTLLGCGVVANVVLEKTKGHQGGWIVITWGWGMGVFIAVFTVGQFSGAHINPAVTLGLAAAGLFQWAMVAPYMLAQTLGAFLGAALAWIAYQDHFAATQDKDLKLAVFSTAPEIRNPGSNLTTEAIGTFVLVFCVMYMASPGFVGADGQILETIHLDGKEIGFGLGALSALPVGLLVFGIGLALGGPTGYAINPARDLGPRIAHALLPIPGKGSSNWSYSWVPVLGPAIGALLAAGAYLLLQ